MASRLPSDDGVLPLVPPGAREEFVDLPRGRVRVLRSTVEHPAGSLPLLAIHGGGSDNAAISWFELFDAQGPHRAVHAPDLPGFGHTDIAPVGGAAAQADVVAEVAGALGLDRAVVVGVSMGGDVAMNLALRRPDLVAALVLVGSGGLVARLRNRAVHLVAWLGIQLPDRVMDPMARLANRYVATALRRSVRDLATLPAPAVDEFVREARRLPTSLGYRRYNEASVGPTSMRNNLLDAVGRIEVPTLLFHGEDDPLVDPEGSREAARRMPRARLVLVDDCGHWAHLEASERFHDEVRTFLADL